MAAMTMKKVFTPENEVDLCLLKSILASEGIDYFVLNDHFGSLYIGPQIPLYNARIIMVPDEQYSKAKSLVLDYLNNISEEKPESPPPVSIFNS